MTLAPIYTADMARADVQRVFDQQREARLKEALEASPTLCRALDEIQRAAQLGKTATPDIMAESVEDRRRTARVMEDLGFKAADYGPSNVRFYVLVPLTKAST